MASSAAATDDGSEFVKRELFGGAITVDVPRRFVDVSAFRQVCVQFVALVQHAPVSAAKPLYRAYVMARKKQRSAHE